VYDMDSGELFINRDVIFFEGMFPYVAQGKLEKNEIQNVGVCFDPDHVANEEDLCDFNATDEPNEAARSSESIITTSNRLGNGP